MSEAYKITLKNVGYKTIKNGEIHEILKGIDITIEAGDRVALIGRNGSGKTTLVNILSGDKNYLPEPYRKEEEMIAKLNNIDIQDGVHGVVTVHQFIQDDLIDRWSIIANIRLRQDSKIPRVKTVDFHKALNHYHNDELKHKINFPSKPQKLVRHLSGGQKQFLNVLIALKFECNDNCNLLILDEYLNSLDVIARDHINQLVEDILKENISPPTVIVVTHDLNMAIKQCKTIICLKQDGKATIKNVEVLRQEYQNDDEIITCLKETIE